MKFDFIVGFMGILVENSILEFWVIMDIIVLGCFGSFKDFMVWFKMVSEDFYCKFYEDIFIFGYVKIKEGKDIFYIGICWMKNEMVKDFLFKKYCFYLIEMLEI